MQGSSRALSSLYLGEVALIITATRSHDEEIMAPDGVTAKPIMYPTKFNPKDMPSPGQLRWKNLRRQVFAEAAQVEKYPFYAMSVPNLLAMEEWRPHQDLLADGLLKKCEDEDDVIFVSHQWLSFKHPDPQHEQLKSLKKLIRRLLAGELAVESNAVLQVMYGLRMTTTRDEWKRRLPKMYVWLDFISSANPDAYPAAVDILHKAGGTASLKTKGKMLPMIRLLFGPVMRVQNMFGNINAHGFLRMITPRLLRRLAPKGHHGGPRGGAAWARRDGQGNGQGH